MFRCWLRSNRILDGSGQNTKKRGTFPNWHLKMLHSDTPQKLNGLTAPRKNCRFSRISFLSIALFLALGIAGSNESEAASIWSAPVTSVESAPQFAIADFDGDLRPDLASVRSELESSGAADYWIDLRLTANRRQSIQVVAPFGGLLIEARDVNGDHALDLVLSTRGHRESLTVLLNDGSGHFSKADPTSFPGAFSKSDTSLESSPNHVSGTVGVPKKSRAGFWLETRPRAHLRQFAESILFSDAGFPLSSFVVSHAGRAPPSEVYL